MTTTNPTNHHPWNWRTDSGLVVEVEPIRWPADFEWYADQPGQRPPQFYRVFGRRGEPVEDIVVHPVEPWSAYDAVGDKLRARGWEDLAPQDDATCEHGLSASLCAGPEHYPMDEGW